MAVDAIIHACESETTNILAVNTAGKTMFLQWRNFIPLQKKNQLK